MTGFPPLFGFRLIESPHMVDRIRVRTHRKKRIDKKWRKRYGWRTVPKKNVIKMGDIIMGHPQTIAALERAIQAQSTTAKGR